MGSSAFTSYVHYVAFDQSGPERLLCRETTAALFQTVVQITVPVHNRPCEKCLSMNEKCLSMNITCAPIYDNQFREAGFGRTRNQLSNTSPPKAV